MIHEPYRHERRNADRLPGLAHRCVACFGRVHAVTSRVANGRAFGGRNAAGRAGSSAVAHVADNTLDISDDAKFQSRTDTAQTNDIP